MGTGKPYREENGEGAEGTGTLERKGKKFMYMPESVHNGKQIIVNTVNVIPQRAAAR